MATRGITWPIDGDAGLVFRSAHFATYFKILSVKFEPLCIGPIMSTKAEKGDRKREIEQSPMKKKFRDSAISSEDLDNAIANRIELAFKEHQSTLNSVVNSAVRDAMDSVLIPALRELREDIQATNKSVKELREEFEAIVYQGGGGRVARWFCSGGGARGWAGSCGFGGSAGAARRGGGGWWGGPVRAGQRWTGGASGGGGGSGCGWFSPGWSFRVGSFLGGPWRWGGSGASRVWRGGGSGRPRTLIFRVLGWHGRSGVLGVLVGRVRWGAHRTMSHCCFFSWLWSGCGGSGGGAFGPVLGRVAALGLRPFLVCPAVVGLRRGGGGGASIPLGGAGDFVGSVVSAGVVCRGSAGGRRGGSGGRCFFSSAGGAWRPGWTWP